MDKKQVFDVVIIGAGLTGLTTATYIIKEGLRVLVLEKKDIVGGQIRTYRENGFVIESGPNTGSISNYEVLELFNILQDKVELIRADKSSGKRLIWKGNDFQPLPSGLYSGLTTPLFSCYDKFRILAEPFRKKSDNPYETVGELTQRRLGKSFLNYAVDPFISGVYAGDPMTLVTKYALPKLYNLEQTYGSFIKGAVKKSFKKKDFKEKAVTKEVFSTKGGLSNLIIAMRDYIGEENIKKNIFDLSVIPEEYNKWNITFSNKRSGERFNVHADNVVTTTGAYELGDFLPFIPKTDIECLSSLIYAPIVQVSVAMKKTDKELFNAFGGLVPSIENKNILGVLFPSKCFKCDNRTPEGKELLSVFIGGVKKREYINMSDNDIEEMVVKTLPSMMKCNEKDLDIMKIFKHEKAIPQYEKSSGDRFECIYKLENKYTGLYIKGNIIDGIGMSDRIKQGVNTAKKIVNKYKNKKL